MAASTRATRTGVDNSYYFDVITSVRTVHSGFSGPDLYTTTNLYTAKLEDEVGHPDLFMTPSTGST